MCCAGWPAVLGVEFAMMKQKGIRQPTQHVPCASVTAPPKISVGCATQVYFSALRPTRRGAFEMETQPTVADTKRQQIVALVSKKDYLAAVVECEELEILVRASLLLKVVASFTRRVQQATGSIITVGDTIHRF